ncbi:MAG: NAD-dependent epimerase/dehydratase family protein [Thermodesulfobacteriota bacterium]
MKALITGAGGFIGSFLLEAWTGRGDEARVLFLPGENAEAAEKRGAEIFRGDLTRPETLKGIGDGVEIVFHLAARVVDWGSKKVFSRIMVDGTRNLLEAAGQIDRFVYFSSIAALGFGRDLVGLDEDAVRKPCGVPYSDTKMEAEDLVTDFCRSRQIAYTIIRPANVTGPKSVWVTDIIDAFMRGPLPLIAGGKNPGSFVYIDNLVDGILLAAEADIARNRTYHFRDDYTLDWKTYLEALGALVEKKPAGNIPFSVAWGLGAIMERLLTPLGVRPPMTRLAAGVMGKNNDVNVTRARTELGWKTRITEDAAMSEIKDWVTRVYLPSKNGPTPSPPGP